MRRALFLFNQLIITHLIDICYFRYFLYYVIILIGLL
jgi:hypothetical protein